MSWERYVLYGYLGDAFCMNNIKINLPIYYLMYYWKINFYYNIVDYIIMILI